MGRGPGRPPEVTDDEILEIFISADDPVLTPIEIAERLDIERRGILDRLRKLESRGVLRSKSIGSSGVVWWYPGYTDTVGVDAE